MPERANEHRQAAEEALNTARLHPDKASTLESQLAIAKTHALLALEARLEQVVENLATRRDG
jgi:hypothetical protein